jgi:hypothetical protein
MKNVECWGCDSMCLIVDANLAALVFNKPVNADFKPIIDWLTLPKKDGILVVGGHLAVELDRVATAKRFVRVLQQAGRARIIPNDVTDEESRRVAGRCVSNDSHVIALARISGARIVCSRDADLHADFTNPALISAPRGHVYQNARHQHLLRQYGHTTACKQRPK